MGDRHEHEKTTFRPPPEVKQEAQQILNARDDWNLNEFLIACLVMLTKNPDAMLNRLETVRPRRRRGRPRKEAPPPPSE